MQILSGVSFEDLRIGDRVRSRMTGNEGFISDKIPIEFAPRNDDNALIIKWESNKISMQHHYQFDMVWLI